MSAELWSAWWAFNAASLAVLLARLLWRRYLGPSATYRLWWMPVLCALVVMLPGARQGWTVFVPVWAPARSAIAAVAPASADPWAPTLIAIWAVGALVILGCFVIAQWRLQQRLRALPRGLDDRAAGLPVVRAEFGPALVGLWDPQMVLPCDFEQRYTPAQQALAIAHEYAHYRSADLWVRAMALLLSCVQWWNPLAWIALTRLIEDQESACDARVLQHQPQVIVDYARTLVAGHSSRGVGALICCIQTHPIIRRLTMLKRIPTQPLRARMALLMTFFMLCASAALAWASSNVPAPPTHPDYVMQFRLQIDEGEIQEFGLGALAGEVAGAKVEAAVGTIEMEAVVEATESEDQVLLRLVLVRDGTEMGRPELRLKVNGDARVEIGTRNASGFTGVRLDVHVARSAE